MKARLRTIIVSDLEQCSMKILRDMSENGEITGEKVRERVCIFPFDSQSRTCASLALFLLNKPGTGSLFHTDGSEFRGTFRGDEKVSGVLHLPDGIMRREHYDNGVLQG
jgi:hypothetical protein